MKPTHNCSEGSQPSREAPLVTVSGSFRRAMQEVQEVVAGLVHAGALVLSPADPRIVDQFGDFVFVASDRVRHIRTVQSRHLAAIAASDFVWLVAPDGYVGVSAAMEIGYAAAAEVPVFSADVPTDLTLRQWVTVVHDPGEAMGRLGDIRPIQRQPSLLIDPHLAIQRSHDDLLVVERGFTGRPSEIDTITAYGALRRVQTRLTTP